MYVIVHNPCSSYSACLTEKKEDERSMICLVAGLLSCQYSGDLFNLVGLNNTQNGHVSVKVIITCS